MKANGALGAYGRDELNDNGERLLNFATGNKLAVTKTFFSNAKVASRALTTASSGIAHRLHPNTPEGTPAESTQRRSKPAVKSADPSGLGSHHGVWHRGFWGTIRPQPSCTADSTTPVIRQKPAEDEIPPVASGPEVRRQHRRDSKPASRRGGGD